MEVGRKIPSGDTPTCPTNQILHEDDIRCEIAKAVPESNGLQFHNFVSRLQQLVQELWNQNGGTNLGTNTQCKFFFEEKNHKLHIFNYILTFQNLKMQTKIFGNYPKACLTLRYENQNNVEYLRTNANGLNGNKEATKTGCCRLQIKSSNKAFVLIY